MSMTEGNSTERRSMELHEPAGLRRENEGTAKT